MLYFTITLITIYSGNCMCGIVFMVDRNLGSRNTYLGTTIFTKSIHKRCIGSRYLKLFSTQLSRQDPPIMTGAPPPFIRRPWDHFDYVFWGLLSWNLPSHVHQISANILLHPNGFPYPVWSTHLIIHLSVVHSISVSRTTGVPFSIISFRTNIMEPVSKIWSVISSKIGKHK